MFSQTPLSGAPFGSDGDEVIHEQVTPSTGVVSIVGEVPQRGERFLTPLTGAINTQYGWGIGAWNGDYGWGEGSQPNTAPIVDRGVVPTGGAQIIGSAPVVISTQFRILPATGVINVLGQTPAQNRTTDPAVGAVNIIGAAPSLGLVIEPGTGSVVAIGIAPGIAISRVITPPSGAVVFVVSAPIIQNPNWGNINDNQDPSWSNINDSQPSEWSDINDSQMPNWIGIAA